MPTEERAGWEAARQKAGLPRRPSPGFPHPSAHQRARHAIQLAVPVGPGRMGCISWALARRSRHPEGSFAQPGTGTGSPSCRDELFPGTRSVEGGRHGAGGRVVAGQLLATLAPPKKPRAICFNQNEDTVSSFPDPLAARASGARVLPRCWELRRSSHAASRTSHRLLGHEARCLPHRASPAGGLHYKAIY